MTNLEFMQKCDEELFTNTLALNIDKFCEQRYSTKEDEQGLLVTYLDKDKFIKWLKESANN